MTPTGKLTERDLSRWLAANEEVDDFISAHDRDRPVASSSAQIGTWLAHNQSPPGNGLLLVRRSFWLRGRLDVPVLRQAFQRLVARQEILRTGFATSSDGLKQTFVEPSRFELNVTRATVASTELRHQEAVDWLGRLRAGPVDLEVPPLVWADVFLLDDECALFDLSVHRSLVDARSITMILGELAELYRALKLGTEADLVPIDLHYADYAARQNQLMEADGLEESARFWREELHHLPSPLALPDAETRSEKQKSESSIRETAFDAELIARLTQWAHDAEVTVFQMVTAAFQFELAELCARDDFVVGVGVSGRTRPETKDMVGPFSTLALLSVRGLRSRSFDQQVKHLSQQLPLISRSSDFPVEAVVAELGYELSPGELPWFQVAITHNDPMPHFEGFGDVSASPGPSLPMEAQRDLTLYVGTTSDGDVGIRAVSALRAMPPERVEALLASMVARLAEAIGGPAQAEAFNAEPDQGEESLPTEVDCREACRSVWDVYLPASPEEPTDFFHAGGNSRAAVRAVRDLSVRFDSYLPASTLLRNPDFDRFVAEVYKIVGAS